MQYVVLLPLTVVLNRAGFVSRQRPLGISPKKHLNLSFHLPSNLSNVFHLSCYRRIRYVPIHFQTSFPLGAPSPLPRVPPQP